MKIIKDEKKLWRISEECSLEKGKEVYEKLFLTVKGLGAGKCLGLSAPQIGEFVRVLYLSYKGFQIGMINPVIIKKSSQCNTFGEGCLSLPKTLKNRVKISRPKRITVVYMPVNAGNVYVVEQHAMKFSGMDARILQHEIDHLNGVLITDYLEEDKNV